jgi:CRP-like cAMP-binding protein
LLRGVPRLAILAAMNADDQQLLEAVGVEVEVPAGKVLIERGHPGAGLYVILEGTVLVDASEGTRELGEGVVVGERALLSADGTRTARVRTKTDVRLLAVDRIEVERLSAEDPEFARRLTEAGA